MKEEKRITAQCITRELQITIDVVCVMLDNSIEVAFSTVQTCQGYARTGRGQIHADELRAHDGRSRAAQQVGDPLSRAVPQQAAWPRRCASLPLGRGCAYPPRGYSPGAEGRPAHDDHCKLYETIAR